MIEVKLPCAFQPKWKHIFHDIQNVGSAGRWNSYNGGSFVSHIRSSSFSVMLPPLWLIILWQ
jgi:hypothetical protein